VLSHVLGGATQSGGFLRASVPDDDEDETPGCEAAD